MKRDKITLEGDTPGQQFSLPVIRFGEPGDGPAVYMQACLHAHELPGMVALDRLIPLLQAAEREGRLTSSVTLVLHANPIGLTQGLLGETLGRFDFYGRDNFNRAFPDLSPEDAAHAPADQRLKALLVDLATEADVTLDLHCDHEGPVYLYVLDRNLNKGLQLARSLAASVILTDRGEEPFSFVLKVSQRWAGQGRANDDRFSATVELRGMADVTSEYAEHDAQGLYRYLVDIGCVTDTLPSAPAVDPIVGDIGDAELILTPAPGAVLYHVEIGDWVAKGQCMAEVVSEAGMPHHDILAPFEGLVVTRPDRRLVRRGDYVIKVLRHARP